MRDKSVAVGRLLIVTLLSAIVAGCGSGANMSNREETKNPDHELPFGADLARAVSIDSYEKIKEGMTETEVEAILGKGKEQASSSVNIPNQSINVPGGGNVSVAGMSSSAKVVNWQDGFKIITVMFSDGKVMSKAHFGL